MNAKFGQSIWGARESRVLKRFWSKARERRLLRTAEHVEYVPEAEEAAERDRPSFMMPIALFILGLLLVRAVAIFMLWKSGKDIGEILSLMVI